LTKTKTLTFKTKTKTETLTLKTKTKTLGLKTKTETKTVTFTLKTGQDNESPGTLAAMLPVLTDNFCPPAIFKVTIGGGGASA